nr:alpha/beta fold hydrolase [Candidatus Woesearchaeota archaeon]
MKKLLLLLFLSILLISCTKTNKMTDQPLEEEEVTLITSDSIKLAGLYYPGKLDRGIVLLHQLNLDKSSWHELIKELNKANYYVLAIDLRGHGESEGEKDFINMILDAKAGHDFMRNAAITRIAFVGSSIGANTALIYGSENKLPVVALSPGLDYKGIKTEEAIKKIKKAFIIATEQDEYSFKSSKKLKELNENIKLDIYPGKAHGTYMFLEERDLSKKIIEWLNENI